MKFFSSSKTLWLPSQDQASTSVLCSQHHKLVCSGETLSGTLKTSHQQKSLRKREEEQCGVRSCSAHQIWVHIRRAVTQGLECAAWKDTAHLRALGMMERCPQAAGNISLGRAQRWHSDIKSTAPSSILAAQSSGMRQLSCPKADPPWRNTTCWQSWRRD